MWILGTVLGVFLFLLLLLAVPVDLVFSVEKGTEFKRSFRVGWMFGLVSKEIKGKEKPEKKKKRRGGIKYLLAALKTEGFVGKAATLLKRTLRQIRMHEVTFDFDVGFTEPADTGMLFAAVGPATIAARSYPPLDLRIRPDFARERLEGYARGDIRVYPIALLAVFTLFALSLTTLKAAKNMVAVRRR